MDGGTQFRARLTINEYGLRGPALPPAAEDAVRILCLGDSLRFGTGVEHQRTYPTVMEEILRERHPRPEVQVVNAGIPHYGTIDERDFLAERGAELRPDLLILQFYAGDDFEQNRLPSRERHEFRGDDLVYIRSFSAEKDPLWLRTLASIKHHSHLVHWSSQRVGPFLMRIDVLGDLERASSSHFSEDEVRRTRQLLAEIHAIAARLGARMLFVFVPERMQLLARPTEPLRAAEAAREAARETGAAFVDLTPILVSDVQRLYWFEIGVWNESRSPPGGGSPGAGDRRARLDRRSALSSREPSRRARSSPHRPHGSGGRARVILDLLEARDSALDVCVVSLRSHCLPEARERIEASGASYRGLGLSRWNPLALRRIREALLERPVDVVHTHLEFSHSLGVIATHSLGRDRPRVINHVHNYPAQQYRFHHRLAGRALALYPDAHVVASPSIGRAVRQSFGNRLRRLEVIPCGIDAAWLERGGNATSQVLRAGARRVVGRSRGWPSRSPFTICYWPCRGSSTTSRRRAC